MSKLITSILLLFLICLTNLTFGSDVNTKDSTSNHLQEQLNKYKRSNVDSCAFYAYQLLKYSKTTANDSLLIRTHQNLGDSFRYKKQLDSSLYHYNTALKIAKEKDIRFLISRSYILIAINYSVNSELKKTIHYYKKAIGFAQQYDIPNHKAIVTNEVFVFNKLGDIYMNQGDLQKALEAFLNANIIVEKNELNTQKISTLINIGNVYSADKQWEKALTKQNEILELAKENNDIYYQAIANNNIGTIYEDLNEYNKARIYYIRSLELRKSGDITKGLSSNYHNLGSINYRLGDYEQAIYFLNKSLAIPQENGSNIDYIYNYEFLSRVYIETKEFDKAAQFLSKSINLAKKMGLMQKQLDLAKLQTEYYFEIGKLKLAQMAFAEYDSLRDNFIENEKSEKIIQMQTLYETEKKEKENDLLKAQNELSQLNLEKEIQRKNQFIISFGISLLILVIIIFFLRRISSAHKIIKDFNIKLEDSNEKLQLINNTKDKFFSIIAHDLRSPLGAILSFSNLINDECSSSKDIETVAEYNTYLNQSAHNLNSLLENLLQWSKSQLGSIKHLAVDFDLSEIIDENIEIQRLKAKEKSIDIKSQVDQNIHVYADINMLSTIIRNLLNNAIKFSYPKSEITISAKTEGNMLSLSVQDQGIGIDPEMQDKLFNIASNTSTLGTNNETGTGLGLILCKEFVETNGGSIWITSEKDKGSIFTFTVPLKEV